VSLCHESHPSTNSLSSLGSLQQKSHNSISRKGKLHHIILQLIGLYSNEELESIIKDENIIWSNWRKISYSNLHLITTLKFCFPSLAASECCLLWYHQIKNKQVHRCLHA
jgi:hypothetical protein